MGRESSSVSPQRTRQELLSTASSSHQGGENSQPEPVKLQRASGLTLVANTPKGRGIFAFERIPASTVIEVCPVLVLDPKDAGNHISKTMLDHYTYNWPWNGGTKTQVVVLGLGSMFNHSTYAQNVTWTRDVPNECITYRALRDIEIGEELCISYGNGRLWFHDTDAEIIDAADEEILALNGLERIQTS